MAEKMNKCTFWLIFKINPVSNPGHPGQSLNKKPGQIALPFGRVLNSVYVKLNWDANGFWLAESKDCMNSASYEYTIYVG